MLFVCDLCGRLTQKFEALLEVDAVWASFIETVEDSDFGVTGDDGLPLEDWVATAVLHVLEIWFGFSCRVLYSTSRVPLVLVWFMHRPCSESCLIMGRACN